MVLIKMKRRKFTLTTSGLILSSWSSRKPLDPFVTDSLLTVAFIGFEVQFIIFIYCGNDI